MRIHAMEKITGYFQALFDTVDHGFSNFQECVCVWITLFVQMETGQRLGIRTTALLVRMDNVLGQNVGNTLEISEALECLQGRGPQHVIDVVCTAGRLLLLPPSHTHTHRTLFTENR